MPGMCLFTAVGEEKQTSTGGKLMRRKKKWRTTTTDPLHKGKELMGTMMDSQKKTSGNRRQSDNTGGIESVKRVAARNQYAGAGWGKKKGGLQESLRE